MLLSTEKMAFRRMTGSRAGAQGHLVAIRGVRRSEASRTSSVSLAGALESSARLPARNPPSATTSACQVRRVTSTAPCAPNVSFGPFVRAPLLPFPSLSHPFSLNGVRLVAPRLLTATITSVDTKPANRRSMRKGIPASALSGYPASTALSRPRPRRCTGLAGVYPSLIVAADAAHGFS